MGDKHPDSWTSTRNFHICYAFVRTMIGICPNCWSRIGNFHISCTRVRTGNHIVWMGISIFPYSELGKNLKLIDHWEASGQVAKTSGRIQAGTVASRYSRGPKEKWTSSGWMMLGLIGVRTVWYIVRMDGTVVRWVSGRLAGNRKLLSWKQCRIFWHHSE